ncbi:HDOD domain-containing protein [Arcobacter peruensis]|uniref:HDOD domain-containing protein n=1 Tax=Arcobacter peruensis TaxID=2320140 RepID=UPI000F077445|nr:HDOD domain-containing protein [Arcobacter peruensis]
MKKNLIEKIDNLPPLPSTILELDDFKKVENSSPEKLIKIIEKDPLMVTTILRVANSSMFGFRSKVDTLSRAIHLLGMNFTISIAMGSVIQETLKSNLCAYAVSTEDFIYSSALASKIVNNWISSIDFDLKDELLLPAFLQETGKFVISEVIQEKKQTEDFLKMLDEKNDITFCEKEFTGFTCARITANIFKNWSLGHNLVFSIGFVGDLENCPKEFIKKVQILEIVKILADIRNPLNDKAIEIAMKKVVEYDFDLEHFLNSLDAIKEEIENNS